MKIVVLVKSLYWDELQNHSWRWIIVLEIEPQHAENTHLLVQIQIPEFMQRFQDKLQLDQFFKFISHDILTSVELKFRFLPQQRKIENPGGDILR